MNQKRLSELALKQRHEVRLVCSHPAELAACRA